MQKDWLQIVSEKHPQNTAIRDYSTSYTYGELNRQVSLIATHLKSSKYNKQYIPLEVSFTIYFVKTLFASWRIGLTPILLRESINKNELDEVLKSIGSSYYLSLSMQKNIVTDAEDTIRIDDPSENRFINDAAVVIFTSGTAGTNKGVILSFKNFEESFKSIVAFDEYKSTDIFLASLPFNHIGGLSIIIRSLLAGGMLQLPKSLAQTDLAKCIKKYKPNYISLVPTQLKRLLDDNLESYDELKSIYVGGSASDKNIVQVAINKSLPLVKVYGSTETCAMVTAARINNNLEIIESAGKPLQGVKIGINKLDSDTNIGEITIESNSVFKGYFNDYGNINEAKQGNLLFTYDIGYLDENNFLYVVGRTDDIIITGGEKVLPAEVRNCMLSLETISDAFVFGIEDSEWGQKVVALISPVNENVSSVNIITALKKQIAGYKIPKTILKVDEIPKNDLGKYDRITIKELFNHMLG